ncbi:MAG: peptide-methionine (R)-S-oxide reductase MsrB [Pararhodobacter sp.]|nr:peptide-methionine (R)-S-oxide reductase MsrB [Pararhodobacter sp.]
MGAALLAGVGALALGAGGRRAGVGHAATDEGANFEISLSEEEWRARLSPAQFAVLREHATEQPFTNSLMGERSPLLNESRAGSYLCAGCGNPLYRSETKYDSRTGWPSFWQEIEGAVGYAIDTSFFMRRTEVHCARCGGHLGHVFEDGPQPTGLRHCINGLAMAFRPD